MNLKSTIKSLPVLLKLVRAAKRISRKPLRGNDNFQTLSPDVLIAIIKAFNLQRQATDGGRNLLDGYAYYEFGMFKGFSFWFAEQVAREYTNSSFRFLGFDSFEGLPQPQLEVEAQVFRKGDFRGTYEVVIENLRRWKADFSRIQLYKGFYSSRFCEQLREKEQFPPVSICLIDVDLYDSCIPVLEFIKEFLVEGSILLFDDYNQLGEDDNSGERRALIEFESQNPGFKKEHLFNYGWEGAAFRVVSL